MKSLELELEERIFILESNNVTATGQYEAEMNGRHIQFICKGSELTEEIAKEYVEEKQVFMTPEVFQYKNYENDFSNCLTALNSFISAIEAKGWYWENPLGEEPKITEDKYRAELEFMEQNPKESVFGDHYADWSMWQAAEEKTFHPEKCLIFKIFEG